MSQMFICGLSDLLSCGRFVGCFCIARILVSSEHKLCQTSSTCIVSCINIDQLLFLSKLLIFFNKAYYQDLYILIIEFINVVNLTEWYDGSFESQSDFEKPSNGSRNENPKISKTRF